MSLRSQLHGRGAQGVGRLQLMPALQSLAAILATTDTHVEATLNRLDGKFELILLGDVNL